MSGGIAWYGEGMDPLAGSSWSSPDTVAGFVRSPPNATLMAFAAEQRSRGARRVLDIGCGAGRNAVPLAEAGWEVTGLDLSWPMLAAASARASSSAGGNGFAVALAPMEALPVATASIDLVIAHGIWNLARSADQFRRAVREGARVAKPGAALFVFTFSRHTLPASATPVGGEPFVFTDFSGEPQCFLTEDQLIAELAAVGCAPDPSVPLRELNRPAPGSLQASRAPVIYEGAFKT